MKPLLIILSIAVSVCAFSQNTTRRNLKLKDASQASATRTLSADTIVPAPGKLVFSGFEKAQQSTIETFFVTNHTDSLFDAIKVTINYFDRNDRQLHSRSEYIKIHLPARETRSVSVKSWDRQKLWYFSGSQARHNEYCNPFSVTISLDYATMPASH